jgi:hypothetical protein
LERSLTTRPGTRTSDTRRLIIAPPLRRSSRSTTVMADADSPVEAGTTDPVTSARATSATAGARAEAATQIEQPAMPTIAFR